jgi:Sulfotransferase domain
MRGDAGWREAVVNRVLDRHLEEWAATVDVIRTDHSVQVTSFGGCGTTAFYAHLRAAGLSVPKTPGQFPFKHQRVPPDGDDVPSNFRAIYLYGDPRDTIVSIFRRNYQTGHYAGLHLQDPPLEVADRLSDLDTFLAAGIDDFQLEDHFERWWSHRTPSYPVLFLRFESLPTEWPRVCDFVGLSSDYPCLPMRPRDSDWKSLNEVQRTQMDRMYLGLARRLESIPPSQIR